MKTLYTKTDRILAILELIGILVFFFSWIEWMTTSFTVLKRGISIYPFSIIFESVESVLPFPGSWIVLLLLISSFGIWTQHPIGIYSGIAAGVGLIYFGLFETDFYLRHYLNYNDLILPINISCFGGGLLLIGRFGMIVRKPFEIS